MQDLLSTLLCPLVGHLLDEERKEQYAAVCRQGVATRCAFAAAQFGEYSEAVFWLQLPRALALLSYGSAGPTGFWRTTKKEHSSATEQKPQESEGKDICTSEVPVNKSLDREMSFRNPKVATPYSPEGVLPGAPFKLVNYIRFYSSILMNITAEYLEFCTLSQFLLKDIKVGSKRLQSPHHNVFSQIFDLPKMLNKSIAACYEILAMHFFRLTRACAMERGNRHMDAWISCLLSNQ